MTIMKQKMTGMITDLVFPFLASYARNYDTLQFFSAFSRPPIQQVQPPVHRIYYPPPTPPHTKKEGWRKKKPKHFKKISKIANSQ